MYDAEEVKRLLEFKNEPRVLTFNGYEPAQALKQGLLGEAEQMQPQQIYSPGAEQIHQTMGQAMQGLLGQAEQGKQMARQAGNQIQGQMAQAEQWTNQALAKQQQQEAQNKQMLMNLAMMFV